MSFSNTDSAPSYHGALVVILVVSVLDQGSVIYYVGSYWAWMVGSYVRIVDVHVDYFSVNKYFIPVSDKRFNLFIFGNMRRVEMFVIKAV